MRVTSAFFVSALIRRVGLAGAEALLRRRGAEGAGAIFLIVDRLDGTCDLYGPAPQSAFAEQATDRLFVAMKERAAPADIEAALAREMKFDPDIWVVAIEDRAGRSFVEVAKV
ncbi:MAG: DUF1491 family protein [Bauldia sp.]